MYLTIPTLNGRLDVVAPGSSLACISVSQLDSTPAQFASRANEVDGDDGIPTLTVNGYLAADEDQLSRPPGGTDLDSLEKSNKIAPLLLDFGATGSISGLPQRSQGNGCTSRRTGD